MYSPELQCVFVHVPRTGGTSVTMALARYFPELIWKEDGSIHPDHLSFAGQCAKYGLPPRSVLSFAFARNPWERYVSFYGFYQRFRADTSPAQLEASRDRQLLHAHRPFEEWFRECFEPEDGDCIMRPISAWTAGFDFVGQYETLQSSFHTLCGLLGLPELPLRRSNERRVPTKHYAEYYSSDLRDLVAEHERPIIERFGYTFAGSPE
jgi:hypothetical protein